MPAGAGEGVLVGVGVGIGLGVGPGSVVGGAEPPPPHPEASMQATAKLEIVRILMNKVWMSGACYATRNAAETEIYTIHFEGRNLRFMICDANGTRRFRPTRPACASASSPFNITVAHTTHLATIRDSPPPRRPPTLHAGSRETCT